MTSVSFTTVMQAAAKQIPRTPPATLMATAALSLGRSSATTKIALGQVGPIDLPTIETGTDAAASIAPAAARAPRSAKHFLKERVPTERAAAIGSSCDEGAA
jgi:hypothetical protein